MKFLKRKEYEPRTHQRFWCTNCDHHVVDSQDKTSGQFFLSSGHAYSQKTKEYDGEYRMVMFAVCPDCMKE